MTTPALGSGRPSATARLLATAVLAVAALPVLANTTAIEPQDPTDFTPSLLVPQAGDSLRFEAMYAHSMRSVFDSAPVAMAAPAADTPAPKGESRIQRMINRGLALLGTPYRWGGTTPEHGFDCSGLVGYVYRSTLGIDLPRISRDMANVGELIRDRNDLRQGDLVFFTRRGGRVDHVGLYLGEGKFLHAPRTGKDVEISTLATGYWSNHFLKGRRVAPADMADVAPAGEEMAVAKAVEITSAEAKAL